MQIKKDFTIQKVGTSSYVAVAVGETSKTFHGMVRLNETGAFLWEKMKKDCSEADLVEALLAEYEVSRETAERDVHRVVELLRENNILV